MFKKVLIMLLVFVFFSCASKPVENSSVKIVEEVVEKTVVPSVPVEKVEVVLLDEYAAKEIKKSHGAYKANSMMRDAIERSENR